MQKCLFLAAYIYFKDRLVGLFCLSVCQHQSYSFFSFFLLIFFFFIINFINNCRLFLQYFFLFVVVLNCGVWPKFFLLFMLHVAHVYLLYYCRHYLPCVFSVKVWMFVALTQNTSWQIAESVTATVKENTKKNN